MIGMVGHLDSGLEGLTVKNQAKFSKVPGAIPKLYLCEYLSDSAHIETRWSPTVTGCSYPGAGPFCSWYDFEFQYRKLTFQHFNNFIISDVQ